MLKAPKVYNLVRWTFLLPRTVSACGRPTSYYVDVDVDVDFDVNVDVDVDVDVDVCFVGRHYLYHLLL